MSCLRLVLVFAITVSLIYADTADAKIEAVKGKHYTLHKVHGPYLVLVTTLRDANFGLNSKGMSAEEAAHEIVYQLRLAGIPAYVYHQKEQLSEKGRFKMRQEELAVMAGNFPSPDHRFAQTVLKYIQNKFQPSFLRNQKSGAIIAEQLAAQPFRRAFIITNPLRPAEENQSKTIDRNLVNLNSDSGDISLLRNQGRFSVKVATFSGNAVVQVSGQENKKALSLFKDTFGRNLDESGQMAWELATALRQASKYGYGRDYEAWVLHDRFKSYVTVGSFDSPNDPGVRLLVEEFQAKIKPNPKTGRRERTPELFSIPKNPVDQILPHKLWFFDQNPRPIMVPGK